MVPDASSELPAKPLVVPEIIRFPVDVDISNTDEVSAAQSAAIAWEWRL
jgi:hypothetical protein